MSPGNKTPNIMIVGCSGSGKSTLATEIGEFTGLRVLRMDDFTWKPNWVERKQEEMNPLIEKAVKQDGWVFEGNNPPTYHLRLPKADMLIWLDFPRSVCIKRILLRTLKNYNKPHDFLPEGCYDRFDWEFIKYVWNYNKKSRPTVEAMFNQSHPHIEKICIKSAKEVSSFLTKFRNEHNA